MPLFFGLGVRLSLTRAIWLSSSESLSSLDCLLFILRFFGVVAGVERQKLPFLLGPTPAFLRKLMKCSLIARAVGLTGASSATSVSRKTRTLASRKENR